MKTASRRRGSRLSNGGHALAEENAAAGGNTLDLPALMDRYREGCKAQENFKAALTVEKTDKSTVTVNGQEKECRGYSVLAQPRRR